MGEEKNMSYLTQGGRGVNTIDRLRTRFGYGVLIPIHHQMSPCRACYAILRFWNLFGCCWKQLKRNVCLGISIKHHQSHTNPPPLSLWI